MKKNLFSLFAFMLLASMFLSACGGGAAPAPTAAAEPPKPVATAVTAAATEEPAKNSGSDAQPAADSIVGTWQDAEGTYAYTADGKMLFNGEDKGTTYVFQDNVLTETDPDGTTRTYQIQLGATEVIMTAEDGTAYTLARVVENATVPEVPAGEAPAGAIVSDNGFRPEVDGFSIPNFGGEGYVPATNETFPVINLTSIEMRRMYGDAVCAAPAAADGTCALTPPASQWMEKRNSGLNGGHCEGFAALSQLIYGGKIDPNQFGATRTIDLQIPGNEALQRELAYWWATQIPTYGALVKFPNPKDAVTYMQEAYAKDPKNMLAIGIYKEDRTGGHAITGYGVRDQGNGIYWIMVYDNNAPGQERYVIVDTNTQTWEYEASTNPSVEPSTYRGGANNPIEFLPDTLRVADVYPCDFCANSGNAGAGGGKLAAAAPEFNEISVEGYVNVELVDDQGRKIGYDKDGKLVNEITEAQLISSRNETLSEVPPVINMPVGMNFTAYLWGDDKAAEVPASLVMIGKGYYVGIDNLVMADGQEDSLYVDGTGDVFNYFTESAESPEIIVGIEKPGADFELWLKAVQLSAGTDISVVFDQKEDIFAFQTTSDGPSQFAISITRIDANGEEETFDTGDDVIDIEPGKLMYFYFGKWDGQGSNLEVGYDENGNGEIEDSEITNMADAK